MTSFTLDNLQVYGDYLMSIGDPRGELIAVDVHTARHGRAPDVEHRRRRAIRAWLELPSDVDPTKGGGYATNYPNPFHPDQGPTTIAYKLDDNAAVTLRIYTQTGSLVVRQEFPRGGVGGQAGLNEFLWDGRNGDGKVVSSGGYIVLIEARGPGETMHVMKRKIGLVR